MEWTLTHLANMADNHCRAHASYLHFWNQKCQSLKVEIKDDNVLAYLLLKHANLNEDPTGIDKNNNDRLYTSWNED